MTARELTYEALAYVLVSGTAQNNATIALASDPQKRRIANDITASLQDFKREAPGLFKKSLSFLVLPPKQISVTVTNGSIAVTSGDTFPEGATILISGDPGIFNEIHTEGTAKKLAIPFSGTSGTYPATVYYDSFELPAEVERVTGPVMLADKWELNRRVNRADAMRRWFPEFDYGRWWRRYPRVGHFQGMPTSYWVEPFLKTLATPVVSTNWLRLFPLPTDSYSLKMDVRVNAPKLAIADLGTDDEDGLALVVNSDSAESILRQLFLKRWSVSPWFKDKEARAQINEDYTKAMADLKTLRVQQAVNRRITAPI